MNDPAVQLETPAAPTYPPPPAVHWVVLLIAFLVLEFLLEAFLPPTLSGFAWLIYLCLWLRKLNPQASSLRWAIASIAVELAGDTVQLLQSQGLLFPTPVLGWLIRALIVSSFLLAMVVVFIIRSELEEHYNYREPMGLYLSPALTFFFSCLYLQYHLYDIAQFRKRQASGFPSRSGSSLFS